MMRRTIALVLATGALAALAATPVLAGNRQTGVATLTGEQLGAFFQPCQDPNGIGEPRCFTDPAPPQVHATCNADGTSQLSLDASGIAVGPYPGTFTVSIRVAIGAQDQAAVPDAPIGFPNFPGINEGSIAFPTGQLASVTESFHIDSPETGSTIDGTKQLIADAANFGVCREFQDETPTPANQFFPIPITGYFYLADMNVLSYDATIQTADGRYVDGGTARAYVDNTFATCCPDMVTGLPTIANSSDGLFVQMFASDQQVALALRPGEGCGDANHAHARNDQCSHR